MSDIRYLTDDIFTVSSLLSPEECRAYIAMTEEIGYGAAPITTLWGEELHDDIRNNTRVILDDAARAAHLWERVPPWVLRFRNGRQPIGLNERFRFYRYDPGQQFATHVDGPYRRDNGEMSLLTFMVYLNDDFAGGATTFDDVTVKPETGMALLFDHSLLHSGSSVEEGRKYVLRSDVMYGPVGQIRG